MERRERRLGGSESGKDVWRAGDMGGGEAEQPAYLPWQIPKTRKEIFFGGKLLVFLLLVRTWEIAIISIVSLSLPCAAALCEHFQFMLNFLNLFLWFL